MVSSVTPRRDRKLLAAALIGLSLWLAAVIVLTLWRYPDFWVEPDTHYARAQDLFESARPDEGRTELEAAIRKAPADAGYRVYRGYRQLDAGEAGAAEGSFREALRTDAASIEARLGLARALTDRNQRELALAELDRLPGDALNADQLRRRSQLYGMLRAPGPALADLSRLLEHGAPDPEILKEATVHAVTLQDWPRVVSISDWMQGMPLDPGTRQWMAGVRARAQLALGQPAAAYESYQAAGVPDTLERRAGLAWDLRKFDEAAALFGELAAREPGEARFARMRAFSLLSAGRREAAEAALRDLVAAGLADVPVRRAYAWMLNVQHRYAEAWRVVEPLPRPAEDSALLELQARTAVWARRLPEAIELTRALLRIRPDEPRLWMDLANVSQAAGDQRQAAEALASYLRLQSHDALARQRLAQMLSSTGSLDAAIDQYRRLLADDPADWRTAAALGLLHETRGDLENARTHYLHAVEMVPEPEPELLLRLARLHRWTSQPRAAVNWYDRYLGLEKDDARRHRAEAELALSLLDAGDPARSLARLEAMAAAGTLDADAWLIAARAAAATSRPDLAVRYLEGLAAVRTLTTREHTWLADAYRAAGDRAMALAVYERVAAAQATPDPRVLEAIADLRYDAGDFAGAVRALQRIGEAADVRLKLARSAARAGDLELASRAYQAYTAQHPADATGALEAARYFAGAGQPARALGYYRSAVDARGAGGLRVELARIHLAAEQFASAEGWARQAVAAGEDPEDARLALAQALHVMGQHAEADATLRALIVQAPGRGDAHAWRARIAVSLDRHYAAYREFGHALDRGADAGERLALAMSTAARKRGDFARALHSLDRAAALGAEPPQLAAARRELAVVSEPQVSLPAWTHADSNDMRFAQAGAGLRFLLPRLLGAVTLEASSGTLSQRAFSSPHTGVRMSVAQLFPLPGLELDGALGFHQFDRGDHLLAWKATATWHAADDTEAGLRVGREPLLPLIGPAPMRQFNRVLDISRVGPGFYSDTVQAFGEFISETAHRARVELGAARMQDGNRQAQAYLHYQVPVTLGVRRWTVLRPNAFFETFDSKRPGYFSPRRHLTAGMMLHTIRRYPQWELELEVNPQVLRTDGATGVGGHGLVNVQMTRGRVRFDLGTFVFYDGLEDYLQWRVGGRVTIPVGR